MTNTIQSPKSSQSEIISQFTNYLSLGSQSEQKSMSENTIKAYITDLTAFFAWKETLWNKENNISTSQNLILLTREEILSYLQYTQHTLKNKAQTVNHKLSTLRKYNFFLIENNYQTEFVIYPSDTIQIQKSKFSPNTLQEEDVHNFLDIIKSNQTLEQNIRNYTITYLLAYSGMRISEALSLELSDLNLNDGEIIIRHGKENKQRTVMINQATIEVLRKYLSLRNTTSKIAKQSPYVFVSQKLGKYNGKISREAYAKILSEYSKQPVKRGRKPKNPEQIKKIHAHSFRHRYVTNCLEKGITIDKVSEQVGHAHIQTTLAYTQPNKNRFREQLELL